MSARCGGSGQLAVEHGRALGFCPACGRLVITDDDGTVWAHELDVLEMVERGDFGGARPAARAVPVVVSVVEEPS